MLGPEPFNQEEARRDLPAGVATGLAWTETGGDVLYIEGTLLPDGKGLTLTGQLGEVMQESVKAAQSYIWSHAGDFDIDPALFKNSGVHVHVPAGAIPKDGPSAGVTMATALTSLYTKLPARSDVAMTGEITLTGLVLPIGGIKEKVLAARRAGIHTVIMPKANQKDLARSSRGSSQRDGVHLRPARGRRPADGDSTAERADERHQDPAHHSRGVTAAKPGVDNRARGLSQTMSPRFFCMPGRGLLVEALAYTTNRPSVAALRPQWKRVQSNREVSPDTHKRWLVYGS